MQTLLHVEEAGVLQTMLLHSQHCQGLVRCLFRIWFSDSRENLLFCWQSEDTDVV